MVNFKYLLRRKGKKIISILVAASMFLSSGLSAFASTESMEIPVAVQNEQELEVNSSESSFTNLISEEAATENEENLTEENEREQTGANSIEATNTQVEIVENIETINTEEAELEDGEVELATLSNTTRDRAASDNSELNLMVISGYASNKLEWESVENATSYKIYVKDIGTGAFTLLTTKNDNGSEYYRHWHKNVGIGVQKVYKIEALQNANVLVSSEEIVSDTTGNVGLIEAATLYKEYEQDDMYFDGTRVDNLSTDDDTLAREIMSLKEGTVIIKFRPDKGVENSQSLFAIKDRNEIARKYNDGTRLGGSKQASIYLWGSGSGKNIRFALGHTQANFRGTYAEDEWHTLVFSNTSNGSKILRGTVDGSEIGSFGNAATNAGLFSRIADASPENMDVLIGGTLQPGGSGARNIFKGDIKSVLVTEEIFTDADAITLSMVERDPITEDLFNNDGNTWVFVGGRNTVGNYADIKGVRNYVSQFEEAIRWQFRNAQAPETLERYVTNIAKNDLDLSEVDADYNDMISSLSPKAVAIMLEEKDLEDVEESLTALKNIIIKNSELGRYSIIILPIPSENTNINAQIVQLKDRVKNIFAEVESIDRNYKQYLFLVDTALEFTVDNISDYLADSGYLNAKGHLKLAKYLSKVLAGRSFALSESALEKLPLKETEIIDELPVVVAGETGIDISGVLNLSIANPKYEIILNDGRKVSGAITGDSITITGLSAAESYRLRISNNDKATKYMYGLLQNGSLASEEPLVARTDLQEEIKAKLEEKANGAKWLFVGDSVTHGALHTLGYDDITDSFAKYLKEDLGRNNDIVINTATSGQDTSEFIQSLSRKYLPYQDADFVVIMFGINDANNRTVSISDFKSNLSGFIDTVRANQSVPVIRVPNALSVVYGDWASNLSEYAEAVREVANEKQVLLIDHNAVWEYEARGTSYIKDKTGYWQNDSIHPNGRGQNIMFKNLIEALFEGAKNSKLYNVDYPIKKTVTELKAEPKLSNNESSITVNPAKLTALSTRGELGVIRINAKAESGQNYQIESRRNLNGRFEEFSLSHLPQGKYIVTVEADLYEKPETIVFKAREIDLRNTLDENELNTIIDIEDVILDGSRENAIDMPSKANEIKNLDAMTMHFRYKVDNLDNSSYGLQALLALTDSRQQNNYNTYGALYINPNSDKVGIELKNAGTILYSKAISNAKIKDKSWHNLTYVFTGSGGLKIYLDGVLKLEERYVPRFSELNSVDVLRLGEVGRDNNSWSFNGKFAMAKVYNKALSEREILDLHKATAYLQEETIPDTAIKTEDVSLFYANYAGSTHYRIPSLFTTKNGVVIAALDKRNTGSADNGNIDTAIRRSFDNGRTWEEIQVVIDIPGRGQGNRYPFTIDPVMVQDDESGRLFMMVDMFPESSGNMHGDTANGLGDGRVEVDFGGSRQRFVKLTNRTTGEIFFIDNDGIVRKVSDKSATTYTVPNYHTGELFNNGAPAGSIFIYSNSYNWAGDLTIDKTTYVWMIYSDDDGRTWSTPKDITSEIKSDWMSFFGLGPGVGIQIKNGDHAGRLVVPVYGVNRYGGLGNSQAAYVIYSDDRGLTWHRGESVVDGNYFGGEIQNAQSMEEYNNQVTESQVVEVGNSGRLKMFSRNVNPKKRVRVATSDDGGQTWSDEIVFDNDLPEPYCQLTIVRYPELINGKEAYIFANPASTTARENGTVRVGYYNPETDNIEWEHSKLIKPGTYAYSCLTVMRDGNIGILYENGPEDIPFTSMNLDWLTYEQGGNRSEVNVLEAEFVKTDNELNIDLNLDQPVVKFGTVKLLVEVDGVERIAEYVAGDNSEKLSFRISLPDGARQVRVKGIRTDGNSFIGNANNKQINDREFVYEIEEPEEENNDNQGNDGSGNQGNTGGNSGNQGNAGGNSGNQGNTGGNSGSGNQGNTGGNSGSGNQGNSGNTGSGNQGNAGGNNGNGNQGNIGGNSGSGNQGNTGGNSGSGNQGNTGSISNQGGSSGGGRSGGGGGSASGGSRGAANGKAAAANVNAGIQPISGFKKYVKNVDGFWKLADATNNTWQFLLKDGSVVKGFVSIESEANGVKSISSYRFDNNGNMLTGWHKVSRDNWYYFGNNPSTNYGKLHTGWLKDPKDNKWYYLDPATGIMKTGWQQINGAWYYLNPVNNLEPTWKQNPVTNRWEYIGNANIRPLGAMFENEKTPDGYFVNEKGAWVEGR